MVTMPRVPAGLSCNTIPIYIAAPTKNSSSKTSVPLACGLLESAHATGSTCLRGTATADRGFTLKTSSCGVETGGSMSFSKSSFARANKGARIGISTWVRYFRVYPALISLEVPSYRHPGPPTDAFPGVPPMHARKYLIPALSQCLRAHSGVPSIQ